MSELNRIVAGLKAKRVGNHWMARCPAHEDKTPSLSISASDNGTVLVKCFAGCSQSSVIDAMKALGIWSESSSDCQDRARPIKRGRGQIPSKNAKQVQGEPVKLFATAESALEAYNFGPPDWVWDYADNEGMIVGKVARWDNPDGTKRAIRPVTRCGDGWCCKGMAEPRPLFQLSKLSKADRVYVLEGEKCCGLAAECGFIATTSSGGASSARCTDWSPLSGKTCIIFPDNDKPGADYARTVADILCSLSPPAQCRIVALPRLEDGQDFEQYRRTRTPSEVRQELEALIAATPIYEPVRNFKSLANPADRCTPQSWPDPQPLPDVQPIVRAFDPALLPDCLGGWIEDIAERMQCPIDFPAVGAIIALAAVIGRKVGIRPKRQDDWLVVPNLWGAVIGRPSVMKSPALAQVLKPLRHLEVDAKKDYELAIRGSLKNALVEEARKKAKKKELEAAIRNGEGDAQALAAELLGEDLPEPTRRCYLTNDSTVEALGVLLNQNPNGVLVFRDELIGFMKGLDREGQESARAFYLEAWEGSEGFRYDRIGRGTLDIEACCVSILGGIQPGPLNAYVRGAMEGGRGDDGLLQRFQLAVWPDDPSEWRNVDRWPNSAMRDRAFSAYRKMDRLDARSIQCSRDQFDKSGIPFLRFDEAGQERFDNWRAILELKMRSGEEHPAMESHLTKYRKLVPALALLLHLADDGIGPVTAVALERAIGWAGYLETHARRLYAMVSRADVASAHKLAEKLRSNAIKDGFSLKDVYRPAWSGLASRDEALAGARVLVDHDWLVVAKEVTDGAPRTRYFVNPKILGSLQERTAKTANSPPEYPFGS